jgi:hypothetical protein
VKSTSPFTVEIDVIAVALSDGMGAWACTKYTSRLALNGPNNNTFALSAAQTLRNWNKTIDNSASLESEFVSKPKFQASTSKHVMSA